MGDISFEPHFLNFFGMGFVTKKDGAENYNNLFAVFYYVHHEQFLSDVNKKLAKKNLRPITRSELRDFFNFHRLSLLHIDSPFFISTSPVDVKKNDVRNDTFSVPGIWKANENELKFGDIVLNRFPNDEIHIPGHCLIVVAIDESKIENLTIEGN